MRGQAIVEFALVLPLLMLMLVAIIASAYIGQHVIIYQQGVGALADLTADDNSNSWHSKVKEIDEKTRCNADPQQPDVEYSGPFVTVTWHCHIPVNWVVPVISVTVSATSTVREEPSPSPSLSPSPT